MPLPGPAFFLPRRPHPDFGNLRGAWHLLYLLWLCAVAAAMAQVQEEGAPDQQSRFQRTVAYLQHAPAEEQADFAAAALAELVTVYMAEADLARAGSAQQDGSARARLLGWSVAVDQYANQLLLVLDDVEQGFPVSLRPVQQGPAIVTVAGRVVILGHPRADQQGGFEQRVLTYFCSSHDCGRMTAVSPATGKPEPIPATVVRVHPLWTFTASGPVCSNDGLELSFPTSRDLGNLRSICEEFVQEVAALATEIAAQRRLGVAIDWDHIAVTATPGRPEHLVRLNAAGDSVLVTMPLLYGSPNLLADIKSWLAARVRGEQVPALRLDAGDYGWQGEGG
jgi:hypothetical protein